MPMQASADIASGDLMIAAAASGDVGVVAGCNVLAASPPTMSVTVVAGTVMVGTGSQVSVSQGSVTLPSAQNVERYDLVAVDGTGTLSIVMGSAVAPAQMPAVPPGAVVLACVNVPPGTLAITPDLISDTRVNIGPKTKPTVTGSKGSNAALTSLLAALVNLNLITDSTS